MIKCGKEIGFDACVVQQAEQIVEMTPTGELSEKCRRRVVKVDNFGFFPTSVWVRRGCQAEFHICYMQNEEDKCDG